MDILPTRLSLLGLAALTLPWLVSDRALAKNQPLSGETPVVQSQAGVSADSALASIETDASSSIPTALLSPPLSASLPMVSSPVSSPAAPTFHAQAIPSSTPLDEDPLVNPLDDGFLTPAAIPSDQVSEELDDEVGELRPLPESNQSSPSQTPPQPNGQLLIRSSAFSSSNVTGNDLTSTDDIAIVNGVTLLVTPKLGNKTRLIATAGGGLTRFATAGENNYNSLDFSLGVQQRFTDTTYGQIGWVNNQLYSTESGDRTLSDNNARLIIGRQDQLDENLRLDTSYELRARFTDPDDRSRISNTLGTRLRYDFSPDWQSSLGYRLAFNEFTQNGRADTTHQIQAATTYTPTRDTFVSGFASYSFGRSSEPTVDLRNLSFGVGVGINLPLF
ncbi:MAG: hypothetical protein AAF703_10095 [Cyanobacteria bacterium P01_D01_bin.105]